MNHTFSLKRFGMLFKKHTAENLKGYSLMMAVFFGILTISAVVTNYHSPEPHQLQPYMMYLVMAGTIFTSTVFINFGEKRRSIASLTLPASPLEKFLVGWIYSFIIFQLLYTAMYYAITIAFIRLGHWDKEVKLFSIFDTKSKVYYIFIVYTILHAVALYGAIAFKKIHFIKTAFALFVIGGTIWLINNSILSSMIHQNISGNPPLFGASFKDKIDNEYYNLDLPYDTLHWLIPLFLSLAVIIWVAAYFRLKEKQV